MVTARVREHCWPMRKLSLALAFALVAVRVDAQPAAPTEPSLRAGMRVRVRRVNAPSTPHVGSVAWVSVDTLEVRLADGDTVVPFPYREIAQLEMSVGKRQRKTLQGAATGMFIGAASGIIIGLASGDDPPENLFSLTKAEKAEFAGAALGVVGLAVGAVIGANHV